MTFKGLETKPVTISSKELFDRYFRQSELLNSEASFTTMFMWQKSYNIQFAEVCGCLCVFSRHGNGSQSANYPIGDGDRRAALFEILKHFEALGQPPIIRLYDSRSCLELKQYCPQFIIEEDRDSFDYVYTTAELIKLTGSKYHGKRNHINKFKESYNYRYLPVTGELEDQCFEMFVRWCDSKKGTVDNIEEQREAVSSLLKNRAALGVKGGCITVDGKMVAFSFGEVLNTKGSSMALIHLEHADTEYLGSFPFINQQFLEHEWSSLKYVNREEDMGIAGLRKAKQSYHPCFMTKKHLASFK